MSEDAPTGDTGQVTDDTAAPSTAVAETSTEETAPAQTSGETTPAETQPAMVPSHRLREETDKRRGVEGQLEAAQAELAALKGQQAPEVPAAKVDDMPPEGLTDRERARWIVQHDVEDILGMPLEQAKTLLGTARTTANAHQEQVWKDQCARVGIDPKSKEAAQMVGGLVRVDVDLTEAFDRAGKLYGKAPAPAAPSATVETTSQTGTMTGEHVTPRDKDHATELATKGVTIGHVSQAELIKNAIDADEKKRGTRDRIRTLN